MPGSRSAGSSTLRPVRLRHLSQWRNAFSRHSSIHSGSSFLRRDQADDVLAQPLGRAIGLDVGDEAVLVLVAREVADRFERRRHHPFSVGPLPSCCRDPPLQLIAAAAGGRSRAAGTPPESPAPSPPCDTVERLADGVVHPLPVRPRRTQRLDPRSRPTSLEAGRERDRPVQRRDHVRHPDRVAAGEAVAASRTPVRDEHTGPRQHFNILLATGSGMLVAGATSARCCCRPGWRASWVMITIP